MCREADIRQRIMDPHVDAYQVVAGQAGRGSLYNLWDCLSGKESAPPFFVRQDLAYHCSFPRWDFRNRHPGGQELLSVKRAGRNRKVRRESFLFPCPLPFSFPLLSLFPLLSFSLYFLSLPFPSLPLPFFSFPFPFHSFFCFPFLSLPFSSPTILHLCGPAKKTRTTTATSPTTTAARRIPLYYSLAPGPLHYHRYYSY